jgi:hypothetical protein
MRPRNPNALILGANASLHPPAGAPRHTLPGDAPSALHMMAAGLLQQGSVVWTTNRDELIEQAAERCGVEFHRLLRSEQTMCECGLGHLVKAYGPLSTGPTMARAGRTAVRSEDVGLPSAWRERLTSDLEGAAVAVIGYTGADIDLRDGLREALHGSSSALWFARPKDAPFLDRRFATLLSTRTLQLRISERPDLAALQWGRALGLAGHVSPKTETLT